MSIIETAEKPKLSIVIASQNARKSVTECLSEIEAQRSGVENEIEIIVVDNSTDGTRDIITRDFPQINLVESSKEKLIPELWGIGINESNGEFIAVTTMHFVPAENWIAETLKIHEADYAGVGGAIENDDTANLVSWAVYFCRYSRYMLPFARENADDFAADNASYKRADLERVKHSLKEGFWEAFVHKEMRKAKMTLILSPEIVVYHRDSFSFSDFMKQRFRHGKQFGNKRAAALSGAKRIALIVLSPLIPFVYLYRITGRIFAKKRNVGKYFLSLPVLFLFLVSWSIGEFSGYLWSSE